MSYKDKEWLHNEYWNNQQSERMIAKQCGIPRSTLQYWFDKFNIPRRKRNELNQTYDKMGFQKGNKLGLNEKNVNWKGDLAGNKPFHNYIKRRKNKPNECELCNEEKKLELSFNHDLGNYTRNPKDYLYICHKCHFNRDKNEFNKHEDFGK